MQTTGLNTEFTGTYVDVYAAVPLQFNAEGINLKQVIGANWIDPPKRERKRVLNYSESEYYKNKQVRRL